MSNVENNYENRAKCPCAKCPSYNECAKGKNEALYCANGIGKSKCEYHMNGCICGPCPVHSNYSLKAGYYCIYGSADQVDK
jgi:hypothetical protein